MRRRAFLLSVLPAWPAFGSEGFCLIAGNDTL